MHVYAHITAYTASYRSLQRLHCVWGPEYELARRGGPKDTTELNHTPFQGTALDSDCTTIAPKYDINIDIINREEPQTRFWHAISSPQVRCAQRATAHSTPGGDRRCASRNDTGRNMHKQHSGASWIRMRAYAARKIISEQSKRNTCAGNTPTASQQQTLITCTTPAIPR